VTGGNTGIGYETTLHLALHGAKVYLGARSQSKATAAIEKIKAVNPTAQVEFLSLDLASLHSVREAAEQISQLENVIDIIICNAGLIVPETKMTDDAIEMDFQINYLGIIASG
jgi:NAD(P)-dependent dehydrogenase (short-subunit alcohol dehydrogenase family)